MENIIIKQIQIQNFQEEIRYLQGNGSSTIPAYIQTLNLFFDDNGLLRCRTRLQNVQLNAVEKSPILIPTHTSYAYLITKESHHKVFHSGVAQTLCHLRNKYWIPRARQKTKSLIRKCFTCKRVDADFSNVPPPPPLQSVSWILAEFCYNRSPQGPYTGTCTILQETINGFLYPLIVFRKM